MSLVSAGILALTLSGCLGLQTGEKSSRSEAPPPKSDTEVSRTGFVNPLTGLFGRKTPQSVSLLGGSVQVRGPQGYCIDRKSSQTRTATPFVLLTPCDGGEGSVPNALLTVTTAPGPVPDADGFARYAASDTGLAALSRAGRAETVKLAESYNRDGLYLLHATDSAQNAQDGFGEDIWRAFLDVNGQIVALSVIALEEGGPGVDAGFGIATAFAKEIRKASQAEGPQLPDTVLAEVGTDSTTVVSRNVPAFAGWQDF